MINPMNFTNAENFIILRPDNFGMNVHGEVNFFLELNFWGSSLIGVGLPITLEVEMET